MVIDYACGAAISSFPHLNEGRLICNGITHVVVAVEEEEGRKEGEILSKQAS